LFGRGIVTKESEGSGLRTTLATLDPAGQTITSRDGMVTGPAYTLDSNGRAIKVTDPRAT